MQTETTNPGGLDASQNAKRKAGNPKWKKGVSGNPSGRPPGIVDRRAKLKNMLEGKAESVLSVVIEAALAGDVQSANIILARVVPTIRAQDERVEFELDTTDPMSGQVEQILTALSKGLLGPEAAKQIIDSIGVLDAIRQGEDLKTRLEALEAQ